MRHVRSLIGLLTPALGLVGWACSGPLLATLAVGRTVLPIPSARWLFAAIAGWLVTAGIGWLAVRRGAGAHAGSTGVRDAAGGLVLLAVPAPLLPLLYLDDASNHLVVGAAGAPRAAIAAYVVVLAAAGAAWRLVGEPHPALPAAQAPASLPERSGEVGSGNEPVSDGPPSEGTFRSPWVVAPVAAVLLMVAANGAVLRPLQAAAPGDVGRMAWLALNLVCLLAAAGLVGRTVSPGWPAGLAAALAWIGFAPLQEALAAREAVGPVLLGGAAAIAAVGRGSYGLGAILLGLISAVVPACGGTLAMLAVVGNWRPALMGGAVAAVLLALEQFGVMPASLLGRDAPALSTAARAQWSTAHIANAALGGFHARLFAGPGALTAEAAASPPLPALYLTLGALVVGSWLVAQATATLRQGWRHEPSRTTAPGVPAAPGLVALPVLGRDHAGDVAPAVHGARGPPGPSGQHEAVSASVCLAATAGLVLAGTAPSSHLVAALLGVIPLLHATLWHRLRERRRALAAGLFVAGYVLAGTSVPTFARAAADLLSRWPPLASLPTLGLILQAAALAVLLTASPLRRVPAALPLAQRGDGRDA